MTATEQQRSLWQRTREPRAPRVKAERVVKGWDAVNVRCAELILSQPWAHGGPLGFACCWARLLLERIANQQRLKRPRANAA